MSISVITGDDPNQIVIGMGELAAGRHPEVLITQALGSCVGVTLWDARLRAGAMAHVLLPAAPAGGFSGRPDRFADIAIPKLVQAMTDMGSTRRSLVAKVAGGAAMFKGESGLDSIGARNVAAVTGALKALGVPIVASDTGGSFARTIELRLDSGVLSVRSYVHGIREI